ncbi:MAG TPA: threonine--tRNA ligase [Dehalococcoidia bacterium]|nr:threonine--tRNA ligase [Dehalococcoidia bacterium]
MSNEEKQVAAELEQMRHSASHVMAQAVQALFPGAKFGIGPAIEDGFYYDFELPRPLTNEDLAVIEAKMTELVARNLKFSRQELPKEEARRFFSGQPYKLELIDELPDETVSIYRQGEFVDLCKGPHVDSTGQVKAFKLTNIAGAYWKGSESRPMLQRIYGVTFLSDEELANHLNLLEEAARRDHRKLGKELDLFSIHEEAGPGLVMWHPKGSVVRRTIEDFWKDEHARRGYDIVYTPHIAKVDLWKTSGHWDFYRDYLYSPMKVEEKEYIVKPMNCLGHILIYKTQKRSYRELPIRYAELGTVYRYERSGVLHGLTRVRGFTQDDAHIFCTAEQLEEELSRVVDLVRFMMQTFGFKEYDLYLSTRPEKYTGSLEGWEHATGTLASVLKKMQVPYQVDPGEGVFYGPKIDIKLKDAIGRSWQGPTIQVDFNLPQRFDVTYVAADGQERQVFMVHRAVLGSLERFMGCLIEHYAGAFPVWLAPVQAVVIPIADRHLEYARKVGDELRAEGLRVNVDSRAERMNAKIRQAQLEKVPYMLVVGNREAESASVSVRLRTGEDLGACSLADFKGRAKNAAATRSLNV